MIRVGMQMKYGIVLVVSALSVLNSSARELLIITNEKRVMEICTEAIRTEHQALGFEKDEAFDLVQLTYQYVPGRPIDGEVLQVVIDQRRPFDVDAEKIGAVIKTTSKRHRFVVMLTKHGQVKSITRSENSSYTMGQALPGDGTK